MKDGVLPISAIKCNNLFLGDDIMKVNKYRKMIESRKKITINFYDDMVALMSIYEYAKLLTKKKLATTLDTIYIESIMLIKDAISGHKKKIASLNKIFPDSSLIDESFYVFASEIGEYATCAAFNLTKKTAKDWYDWFEWDDEFGKKKLSAAIDKDTPLIEIKNINDFVKLMHQFDS